MPRPSHIQRLGCLAAAFLTWGCPSSSTSPGDDDAASRPDASPSAGDADLGLADASDAGTSSDGSLEDASVADATPADATAADATAVVPGIWSTVDTAIDTDFLSSLRAASNSAGDGAVAWEVRETGIRAALFSSATGAWGAPTTFSTAGSYLLQPLLRVLRDGSALLVYLDFPRSGTDPLRVFAVRATNAQWSTPELVATLIPLTASLDVELRDLVIDDAGHAALSWLIVQRTPAFAIETHVATFSTRGWQDHRIGASIGPAHLALDDAGHLHVLHAGVLAGGSGTTPVQARRYALTDDTWSTPVVLVTNGNSYDCGDNRPCYALAAGVGGQAIALSWDGGSSFSGTGDVIPHRLDAATGAWASGPSLGVAQGQPLARLDSAGDAFAVYASLSAGRLIQLESHRYDRGTTTWSPAGVLESFALEDVAVTARGELLARGLVSTTPATTVNVGGAWSPAAPHTDFDVCVPRDTRTAVDERGGAILAQICLSSGGGLPFYVRARTIAVR